MRNLEHLDQLLSLLVSGEDGTLESLHRLVHDSKFVQLLNYTERGSTLNFSRLRIL